MAVIADVVFDCAHPASLARFWAAALDGYDVAPYDDGEMDRLRSLGITDTEDDPSVLVAGPEGAPRLWFQRVPEPKTGKNRVHVDLRCGNAEVELERLTRIGATVAVDQRCDHVVVLLDPEGNEFCLQL